MFAASGTRRYGGGRRHRGQRQGSAVALALGVAVTAMVAAGAFDEPSWVFALLIVLVIAGAAGAGGSVFLGARTDHVSPGHAAGTRGSGRVPCVTTACRACPASR